MEASRTIAYTRVSTQTQVRNSSLATQRFVIEQYAHVHGLVVDEVVREVGSAYRSIPVQMQELARTLPPGSRILVALTDRFSRNIANGQLLLDLFQVKGITVSETMRDQHSNTVLGRSHFDRQIMSAQVESENKALRCEMLVAFKSTDEYDEGSDYEEEDESGDDSGDEMEVNDAIDEVSDSDGEYVPVVGD